MKNIEGGYIGNIKITSINKKTKKISNNFTNGFYKISNLDEFQILVEINGLNKNINSVMMFFEDSNGYTCQSTLGRIDRIFFNSQNILVHAWSNVNDVTNSEESMSNGYVQLEKTCIKCK
jgi:hypothetical protein